MQKENYCNGNILKIPLTYRSNVPADKLIALTWQEEIKNYLKDCIDIELNGVESTTFYKNLSLGIYTAVLLDWTFNFFLPCKGNKLVSRYIRSISKRYFQNISITIIFFLQ